MGGIPRSHRFARSRPLTLCEGGVRFLPAPLSFRALRPVIPSEARNLRLRVAPKCKFPPSQSVRGTRGDALAGFAQTASIGLPASGLSPCGASPAHIASLVRAPLRFAKGACDGIQAIGFARSSV